MAKTYEEWEKSAKESGLYDTFSDKDIEIIKNDTAYGDRLIEYKTGYNNATSDEEREYYAGKANYDRTNYGYYNTVGGDGKGGYSATSHTLNTGSGSNALAAIKAYDSSLPSDKSSKYMTMIDTILGQVAGDKFSYDAKSDPRYALAEEYAQRAMENQMAESAILSGGYGNSYAAAAGQQVYSDYMDEAVNNMEDRAYAKWSAERDNKYNLLGTLQGLEEQAYNRAFQLENQAYEREQTDKQWAYQTESDDYAKALAKAESLAQTGDYSGYKALGWTDAQIAAAQANREKADSEALAGKYDAQIEAFLAYGGKVSDIPSEILASSSYSQNLPLLTQMEKYYSTAETVPYTGGAPVVEDNPFDISTTLSQLAAAGATDFTSAYELLTLKGYEPEEAKILARKFDTLHTGVDKSIPIDYETAKEYALDEGVSKEIIARMMTPAEFTRRNPTGYYGDYVEKFISEHKEK